MIASIFSGWIGYVLPFVLAIAGAVGAWFAAKSVGKNDQQLKDMKRSEANAEVKQNVQTSVDTAASDDVRRRLLIWTRKG